MNAERVREIIKDCLWPESFGVDDEPPPGCEVVDMIFFKTGIDKAKAEGYAAELTAICMDSEYAEQWKGGPSYIHTGAWVGDQRDALLLFAVGHVAGIWKVVTPHVLGFEDEAQVKDYAGSGFVYATDFQPPT